MITVHVTQAAAIARCSSTWGSVQISPEMFEAILLELEPSERELVGVREDGELYLTLGGRWNAVSTSAADVDSVVVAIRAMMLASKEEQRAALLRREAEIRAWLDGERYTEPYDVRSLELEPALVAAVCAKREQLQQEKMEVAAEAKARAAATAEARDAALAEAECKTGTLIAWAREYGSADLRKAIAHGYPLGDKAEDEAKAAVVALFADCDGELVDATDNGERTMPNAAAYTLHDRLVTSAKVVRWESAVGRIVRLETDSNWVTCPNCDGEEYRHEDCECDSDREINHGSKWRTGCVVTVTTPWRTYEIALATVE